MGRSQLTNFQMGFNQNQNFAHKIGKNRKKRGHEKTEERTYRVIVWCGGIRGEENWKGGNEKERKHGRDEDPKREEATEARSTSASSRSNSHWIFNLAPKKNFDWFTNCEEQGQIQELRRICVCFQYVLCVCVCVF